MSQGQGVPISFQFDCNVANPLNSKELVQSITDRDSLDFKYAGLRVHVIDLDKVYRLKNDLTTWEEEGSGSGGTYTEELNCDGRVTPLYIINHELHTKYLICSIILESTGEELLIPPRRVDDDNVEYDLGGYTTVSGTKYLITIKK